MWRSEGATCLGKGRVGDQQRGRRGLGLGTGLLSLGPVCLRPCLVQGGCTISRRAPAPPRSPRQPGCLSNQPCLPLGASGLRFLFLRAPPPWQCFSSLSGLLIFHLFNMFLLGACAMLPEIQHEQDRRFPQLPEGRELSVDRGGQLRARPEAPHKPRSPPSLLGDGSRAVCSPHAGTRLCRRSSCSGTYPRSPTSRPGREFSSLTPAWARLSRPMGHDPIHVLLPRPS